MIYVVIDVATDVIVYAGEREVLAAERLLPGHTYGKAITAIKAREMALQRAKTARWAYGQLGLGPKAFSSRVGKVQSDKPMPDMPTSRLLYSNRRRNRREVLPDSVRPKDRLKKWGRGWMAP